MSNEKGKFTGTYHKRKSFDRKVVPLGNTRVLSLGKVIPKEWIYVRITPLNRTAKSIELLVELLLTREQNAQTKANDKEGE